MLITGKPSIFYQTADAASGEAAPSAPAAPPPAAEEKSLGDLVSEASDAMKASKAKREGPPSKAPTTPKEAAITAADAAGSAGAKEKPDEWVNPIADLLKSEFGPKEPPKDEFELGPDVKPDTANKFQTLRGRAQEAERARDAYVQQFNQLRTEANQVLSQYQQQLRQAQDAIVQMREQNAALAARVDMYGKLGPGGEPREPDAGQQLLERIRGEIRSSEIDPIRKQLERAEQEKQSFQREQQIRDTAAGIREEALTAWNRIVLNGVADTAKSRDLMLGGPAALIALRGARQVPLSQIGPEFRRLCLQVAQDILDAHRTSAAQSRKNAESSAPKAPPSAAPSVLEGAVLAEAPSLKQLRQNGWEDAVRWIRAGRPKLKPLKE